MSTISINTFKVLFYIKKARLMKSEEAAICLRITLNGERAELMIKRSIDPKRWNAKKSMLPEVT